MVWPVHLYCIKGVIVPLSPEKGDFVSTTFLYPKKDGSHCTILNLKQFNKFVEYNHLKWTRLRLSLALVSGQQGQSIHLLDLQHMKMEDLCCFDVLQHIKTSRPGAAHTRIVIAR